MSHVRTSSTSTILSAPRSSFSGNNNQQSSLPFPPSTSFSLHRATTIELRPVPTRNGSSTPFPITPIKFEYPASSETPTMPTSPIRPSTERERRVFADGLTKALGKLKPSKVFAVNVNLKTPPSLVGKRRNAPRVPSPSFSSYTSSSSFNWDLTSNSSSSTTSLGTAAVAGLRTQGSRATIAGTSYRYIN